MKHNVKKTQATSTLATAVLVASGLTIGLSGCGAEQSGDTNEGLITGNGGWFGEGSATSLLLLGGLVGITSLLDSDSDNGGLVVNTAGNEAVAGDDTTGGDDTSGSGDTGNGNDSDNGTGSGDGSNSDENNGDGGTGETDNTDSTIDDTSSPDTPDGTLVEFLQPPDWIKGMWQGTASDANSLVGYAGATAMGTASPGQPIGPYSDIPGASIHLLQNSNSVFEYTVRYPREDGTEVLINEQWEYIDDGSVLYTVSGTTEDQFIMYNTPAANLLQPPNWLQGSWQGDNVSANINESNIVYGNGSTQINYYTLLNHENSVFQLRQNDDSAYSVKITTYDSQGNVVYIIDTFTNTGNNTLTFTTTAEGFQPVNMTRQ